MKISIITVTWNSGATLRDTMESVLSQTYDNFEHIIVDGKSKDNTISIIKELEHRYNGKLKWISEPDKGLYDAMNKGIAIASGDVIGILNSDDFYTNSDILSRIADTLLSNSKLDAVYGDIHFVNDDNLTKCVRYYSSKNFSPWQMRFGIQPAHPSFYCRRLIYEKYGTFDISLRIAADFENMLRFIYINRINTQYIPIDFVTMRTGGASTNGIQSHKRIMSDHFRAYKKNGMPSAILTDWIRYPFKAIKLLKLR